MLRVMVNMRLTDDERALLAKGAKLNRLSESDYLRICMIMDRVMSADRLALKIATGKLREKVGRRVADILGFEVTDRPVRG